MLQHDGIQPVDCVYMDRPGHTVYLQVPVGESVNHGLLKFVYPFSSSFGLAFLVHSPQSMFYFALQICPYNAIKFLPRQQQITGNPRRVLKQPLGKNFVKQAQIVLQNCACFIYSIKQAQIYSIYTVYILYIFYTVYTVYVYI